MLECLSWLKGLCGPLYKWGNSVSSVGEVRALWLGGGDDSRANAGFPDNRVVTSKYTLWNFLPKNLFEQFRRIANFYFLLMAVMSLSIESPVSPATSIAPLVFVILVTTLKQGYEDWLRHRSDNEVNNALVTVVRNGCSQRIKSKQVRVGDLVQVRRDEDVPCDLVLLASSDPQGRAHLTTANLDGETNLKTLHCPRMLSLFSGPEQLSKLRARIECEHPNADLYRFYGKIEVFPADDSVYASMLEPDTAQPTGGAAAPAPDAAGAGADAREAAPAPAPAAQPPARARTLPSPLRPRSHPPEVTWGWPVASAGTVAAAAARSAAAVVGPPTVRHSLAFGETYAHGRRSLKRIGLVLGVDDPQAAAAAAAPGAGAAKATAAAAGTGSVRLSRSREDGDAVPVRRLSVGLSAPLGTENLLLRGTRLRNTDHVFGCAVYTGQETKLALNSRLTSNKFSTIEKTVNKFLIFFLLLLMLEVGASLALKYVVEIHFGDGMREYMGDVFNSRPTTVISDVLSFIILYNYVIPISLYVTIELQKFLGTLFFEWDMQLYDAEMEQAAVCNSSDLNEELGQVEVLFTDKTGTLTENDMQFRRCSVDGAAYVEQGGELRRLGTDMDEARAAHVPALTRELEEFFVALALCHTLQLDTPPPNNNAPLVGGVPEYQASSPDEKALAEAAARVGVVFLGEEGDFASVQVKGEVQRFRKLDVLEFTSDRKRMSVIVEDEKGNLCLYCKGAEAAVMPLADQGPTHATQAHVNDFAMRGLRTMMVGMRRLSRTEYHARGQEVEVARQTVSSRRAELVAEAYEHLESGMRLLGATAVEDRLQDGVQETLESLRAAGIAVWILTGDKVETAVNISFSCGHFKSGTEQLYLTGHRELEACVASLQRFRERVLGDRHRQFGMVVDGQSLALALRQPMLLREVAMYCYAIVCCRMSPLQKSEVVHLVKSSPGAPITAAIGDGANDVSMIQEAHVGLGIMGREGRQAARCSDFAFARFRFLRRVLLVHGHWYYERLATLVQYFFYKNILFVTPQLYYAFFSNYSTQALYDSMFLTLYNLLFTSLPVLVYGLLEQTVPARELSARPQRYRDVAHNSLLRWSSFWRWLLFGFWHSLVVFFVPICVLFINPIIYYNNQPVEAMSFGALVFHNVVVVANLKLLLHSRYWTTPFVGSIAISIIGFMLLALAYSSINISFLDNSMYWIYNDLVESPMFWIISFLTIVICLVPDITYAVLSRYIKPQSMKKNPCSRFKWRKRGHLTISSTTSSVDG